MAAGISRASERQNFRFPMSKLTDIENTVAAEHKNVRNGPTTLISVNVDNTITSNNTKVWVKIYDIVDDTLIADGSATPVIIFPVETVSTNPVAGTLLCEIGDGLRFDEGISIMASKEDGDELAAVPASQVDAIFTTKR